MTNELMNDAELHAYVDGQLDKSRVRVVEAYLAVHPEAAERVAEYQQLNTALRKLYEPVLTQPLPARFRGGGMKKTTRLAWAASVALSVFAGSLAGWQMHGGMLAKSPAGPAPVALVQQAAFAHAVYTPEVRHAVEVSGADEAHLVTWLSKRMNGKLRAPHLQKAGFELVGGRLLPADGRMAAQFMYQNASGVRLTLYVRRDATNETTAFRYVQQDKLSMFYWIDGSFGYALSGEIEKDTLSQLATLVHEQLERG
jgi:anti-sigma factor RsiW